MKKHNVYLRLIHCAKGAIKAARIPRSFSKKKNNVFSNSQHIIMQVLKQFEGLDYRRAVHFFELLKDEIGLKKIPHFTTMNKFALRVKPLLFEQLIAQICKSVQSEIAAIDGTGFSLNHRSRYFCTIAGERKQFMQFNACAELKHKLILAVRLRRRQRNENIDVKKLISKSAKQMKLTHFLADGLYDTKKNHELAEEVGARFIAPIRKMKKQGFKIRGYKRRKLAENFPVELYRKREENLEI
jgi:hypothetical protein